MDISPPQRRRNWRVAIPPIWLTAGSGWLGRGITVLAQLLVVRILTDGLGTDGYGVFAVLASLVGWFALGDFSLAISLQNHISERRAAGQPSEDLVITATLLALGFAAVVAVLLFFTGPFLAGKLLAEFGFLSPWERTLAFWATAYPALGTALGGVVYKVWFARHQGYKSQLLPAAGTVMGTAGAWLAMRLTGSAYALQWGSFAYYLPLAILPLLALAWQAIRLLRRHKFDTMLVKPLLRRAAGFWGFGIMAALVLQVDYIIMAQLLQPADIVIYNVASKIFLVLFFLYNALLIALWPVCSEAIAARRWDIVFASVRKYLGVGVAIILIGSLGFVLCRGWLVHLLVPAANIEIPVSVIALMAVYMLLRVWTDTFAMILQSMNKLTVFWITVPVQAGLSIFLQTKAAGLYGLHGLVIGLIFCFLLTVSWILPMACYRYSRKHSEID